MAAVNLSRKLPQRLALACAQLAVAVAIVSLIAVIKIKADAAGQPVERGGDYLHGVDIDGTVHYLTTFQDTLLMLSLPGVWIGMLATFIFAIAYSTLRRHDLERAGK